MQEYITIDGVYTAEYNEKHSRVIATAFHCESEEQASSIIAAQKNKYWDARHNVYAYLLQDGTARFSDDGEPHGTAGKPVLDVIKGSGITNVLIVVTRYFGGILLGTGGLVKAYSTSAKDSLKSAQCVQMCACTEYRINCDYGDYDRLVRLINDAEIPNVTARLADNGVLQLIGTGGKDIEISKGVDDNLLQKLGLEAGTTPGSSTDKKGFFDKLSDIVTGLIGTEGTLTNLTSSLKDKSKIIQSQKDKVQATLDKKYAMMQKQFATIAVQMNALENSFNSLKNTFDALLNSNK